MKCPVCQNLKTQYFLETANTHGSFRLSQEKFVILLCPLCGVIFPRVVAGKNFYKRYYPQNYYISSRLTNPILQRTYCLAAKFFLRLQLGRYLKTGRVLDFGCGKGEFLASLPPTTEKYGVTINQQAVKFIKEHYSGINIFSDWEKLRSKRLKFDLITLWHALEHLAAPEKILGELVPLLRRDGFLVISTPNSCSLGFSIFKGNWFHLDTPRHLVIFNLDVLRNLYKKVGLKIVDVKINLIEFPLDLFHSLYNQLRTKKKFLNIFLVLFILPISLLLKVGALFYPGKAETLLIVCQKT